MASPEWVTVTDRSLEIVADSPLDLGALTPAADDRPLLIKGDRFVQSGNPATLNCASLAPGFSPTAGSGFPDHEAADRYALQLRRHGYNLVRFHYVDALLMQGAKRDFAVDPEQLDRFQYFVAALSRNGISWLLDVMSSPNAAIGNVGPHRWARKLGMNWRVFVEPAAFAHWQRWANWLLTTPNPYTRQSLAHDPGTLGLILVNEPSLDYRSFVAGGGARAPFLPGLADGFAAWQNAHFPGAHTLPPPASVGQAGPDMARFQAWLTYLQRDATRRMTFTVRNAGYAGSVTSFDNWPMLNQVPLRQNLDFIDMHGYAQNENPGPNGAFTAPSSLATGGRYLQVIGSTRVFGKPFTVSEHGDFFPSPRRFESGLLVPVFAAIQGWDAVCQHADGPIMLAYDGVGVRKDGIHTDSVGLDPVRRVGETLTALIRLRREIAPAPGALILQPDEGALLRAPPLATVGADTGMLGWLVRIGIGPARPAGAPAVSVPLADTAPGAAQSALTGFQGRLIDQLMAQKAISADMAREARAGRWHSPDGTVTLDMPGLRINVVTRFTAATAGNAISQPLALGPLTVVASDAPGIVAASALDGKALGESGRILLMMVSDAHNSGMEIDQAARRVVHAGGLPVTLRRMQAELRLTTRANTRWQLAPLHLDGSPVTTQAVQDDDGKVTVSLDTRTPDGGATTFYLLSIRREVEL
ncbi:hypothetical protein [Novosphingobium sp. AAP93]|uniref:hypothetical protein n=1 Tax=Novosphingobium sp. AAP93 TaxID=1523427 RepID=UPI0006B9E574|nr:hypothetical protein [Novosphingobium sp. AAP93]KPF89734.1 hypothetical protein IP83_01610 [Novosphingobium sp. AAP93]